jgi:hypothetical protein
VKRDPRDDEPHTRRVARGRHLAQHDEADHRRGRRQERDEQGVGRSRQPRHGELVADVRNDRRGHADPDPRAQERGVGERRPGHRGQWEHHGGGCEHRTGEAVDTGDAAASGDTVGGDDVAGEERGVHERQPDAERGAADLDAGHRRDARNRQEERGRVARRSHAYGRERDDGQELDRRDGAEREVVDRGVEARVHRREDGAHARHQPVCGRVGRSERSPGPAPCSQDDRRARDSQPRDAQRFDPREEQDGEGGSEVVEDRAPDEVRVAGQVAHDPHVCRPGRESPWRREGVLAGRPAKRRKFGGYPFDGCSTR